MELAQVADDLYGLDPAEFTAARDERARRARAAGEKALGDAIKKLRRPTVSASLVNRLVREAGDQVDRLLDLGESLREAQQTLAADELRRFSGQRRPAIQALAQEAKRLAAEAGRPVTDPVERAVEATLEAALADPAAAEAVRSGRLTVALMYAGFGGVDVADTVAVPDAGPVAGSAAVAPAPPERARQAGADPQRPGAAARQRQQVPAAVTGRKTGAGRSERPETAAFTMQRQDAAAAARERREAQAAERARVEAETIARDVREAAAAARDAADDLDAAARQVAELRDARQAVRRRIEELEQRLERAQAQEAEAARVLRDAERSRDVAARLADEARRRFARAQAKAEALLKASDRHLPRSG